MSDVYSTIQTPPARLADRIWYTWFSSTNKLTRADYDNLLRATYNAALARVDEDTANVLVTVAFEAMAHSINTQLVIGSKYIGWLQSRLIQRVLENVERSLSG